MAPVPPPPGYATGLDYTVGTWVLFSVFSKVMAWSISIVFLR